MICVFHDGLCCPCYGRKNPEGCHQCQPCPEGAYQNRTGQSSCVPCLPGSANHMTGMVSGIEPYHLVIVQSHSTAIVPTPSKDSKSSHKSEFENSKLVLPFNILCFNLGPYNIVFAFIDNSKEIKPFDGIACFIQSL